MSDTKHIIQSLTANSAIAIAKGIAAAITGSGAMLAEAIHSASDCINQVLLLIGVRRAALPPDATHPLGYGRAVYFWSFLVALLLFTGGGVFSIYEGVHKLAHPEPVEHVWIGIGILVFSMIVEGWATWGNLKDMKQRRGPVPLLRYLRETKDSDLVVVFGENSAAVLGLALAMVAMLLSWKTGDGRFDAVGSLMVGVVLIGVAIFLAVEVKSLLLGEAADPAVEVAFRAAVGERSARIQKVLRVITMQQGPGEVLLAAKLQFAPALSITEVVAAINELEVAFRQLRPDVAWCFIEPDEHD